MKTIDFVIPVYNEEKRIQKTFEALNSLKLPRGLKLQKVIVVNDGSTDKTQRLLNNWKKNTTNQNLSLISYKQNKGKGYAITKGMKHSTADYTLFFDADISTPLSEIKKLIPHINKNKDTIIGTRKNGRSTVLKHQPLYRELLGKTFTKITQLALSTNVTDFTCGFKAFSKNAREIIFTQTTINGWAYDAEIVFLASKNNLLLVETPVIWSNDPGSKVRVIRDSLKTIFELGKIRLNHSTSTLQPSISKPAVN